MVAGATTVDGSTRHGVTQRQWVLLQRANQRSGEILSDPSSERNGRQVWRPQPNRETGPGAGPDTGAVAGGYPAEAAGADDAEGANPAPRTVPSASAAPAIRDANVRVLTPAQNTATAALSSELVAIAERALEDRLKAEQIVAGLCRMQAALVTTATQSAMANQREAAKAELERLVRRAALDAVPPVITDKPTGEASRKATAPAARKVAPPAAVRPPDPKPAPKPALAPAAIADHAPEQPATEPVSDPPSQPAGRRPADRPAGLGELPSTADLPGAAEPRNPAGTARGTAKPLEAERPARRHRLALAVVAMVVTVGGLGLGYLASQPDDDTVPGQLAALPDQPPAPAAPAPQPDPAIAEPVTPEAQQPDPTVAEAVTPEAQQPEAPEDLQLQAMEPAARPLREQAALDEASSGGSAASSNASEAPAALADDDLRIFIHYQRGSPGAALANGLSSNLALTKDPLEVELRAVDFIVAAPRIRYFYADDADAAAALAGSLDPPSNSSSGWQVQDFTHFRPGPDEGTLEVYVPSLGG